MAQSIHQSAFGAKCAAFKPGKAVFYPVFILPTGKHEKPDMCFLLENGMCCIAAKSGINGKRSRADFSAF